MAGLGEGSQDVKIQTGGEKRLNGQEIQEDKEAAMRGT